MLFLISTCINLHLYLPRINKVTSSWSSSLNSCPSSRWPLKAIPCRPQYSMARIIEEMHALFFSTNSVKTLVNEWSTRLFEFWKQETKLFNASIKSLWYDDLDWIDHLSNFGVVAKLTTCLWILGVQPSGKVRKQDKTNHQKILSRPKICNHETIREGKIFLSLRISFDYICKL